MGCCFSKDLSSGNDSEKIGLLQKSVEEERPENKISKTLSSLFDTLEGEEIYNVKKGANWAAADLNMWTRVLSSEHRQGQRPEQSLNSVSSSSCKILTRYEDLGESDGNSDIAVIAQTPGSVSDPLLVSNERQDCSVDDRPLSYVPLHSDQRLQEETFLSDHLRSHLATCKNSSIEKEIVANVQIGHFNENNSLDLSEREEKKNSVCVGHGPSKNARKTEFYSICVIDPDCLNVEEELWASESGTAAKEECHSAVTSEGTHRAERPADNWRECSVMHAIPGAEELKPAQEELSSQPVLDLAALKEAFSQKITCNSKFMDDNPPCDVNVDEVQAKSFRTNADTKLSKEYAESSTLHANDLFPEFSLKCESSLPEERESHSSGIGSQMEDSPVNLLTDTSCVEENNEPQATTVNVDQSLDCIKVGENNSVKPLKDNNHFHFSVKKLDSILSDDLDRINLSPKRFINSVSFRNEHLPVHAGFREANLGRQCDGPKLGPLPVLGLIKEHGIGDSNLETQSAQLAHRGELFLQSGNCSYQDEDRIISLEVERHELKSWCHPNMCTGSPVDKAQTQACDLTCVACEPNIEGTVPNMENSRPGLIQGISPSGKSCEHSRCLQSVPVSSAKEQSSVSHKPEGETHVENSVSVLPEQQSAPHVAEKAEKQSLGANFTGISEDDIENVKTDTKSTSDWETSMLKCRAVPSQDVLTCVSSGVIKNPGFETYKVEKMNETHRVRECKDLSALPPLSQNLNSKVKIQKSEVVENSVNSEESPEMKQIYSEAAEKISLPFGNNVSRLSEPKLTCEEDRLSLEKSSVDPNIVDCLGSCGSNGYAYHVKENHAISTDKESTINDGMHRVGNSQVISEKAELCDTSDASQATPITSADSKDTVIPCSDYMAPFSENTPGVSASPSKMDWQSFPEEFYSQFLNGFSYYPVGGLPSQVLSERLESGYGGYQVGYLCTNTTTKDVTEDKHMFNGELFSKPQDLDIASFSLQQTPFQLPMSQDGVIWGWHSRAGQLVSMFFQCCYAVIC